MVSFNEIRHPATQVIKGCVDRFVRTQENRHMDSRTRETENASKKIRGDLLA